MKNFIQLFVFMILTHTALRAWSQDEMMNLLNQDTKPATDYTTATFKATRVVLGQSCENPSTGDLIFIFSHHFGGLNTGYDNLFGLKQSQVRLGLDYGVTRWLGLGVGLNTLQNTWDGFLKFKVLRQSKGGRRMPFTLDIYHEHVYLYDQMVES